MTTPDEPGWAIDANGNVDVAGLSIPGPLAVQVVQAMRAIYPTITGDLSDVRAVRAVLKYWVTSTISAYASQLATADADEQVATIQAEAAAARAKAHNDAIAAASAISEAVPTLL